MRYKDSMRKVKYENLRGDELRERERETKIFALLFRRHIRRPLVFVFEI